MRNRGMINGDGEFVFVQTYEGVERNGYDDGDNEVIIISDDDSADDDDGDDDGDGDDEEDEEEERSAFDIYRQPVMGVSTQNLQIFANLFASSLISDTMSSTAATATTATTTATTATATATTTTTTAAAATTATMTSTTIRTTEPLQSCCICLSNIGRGGIDLHNNMHSIHISCLMCLLTANNQILWLGASFRFNCPLCRKPVFGTVMLIS